jgi:hypothetical protein
VIWRASSAPRGCTQISEEPKILTADSPSGETPEPNEELAALSQRGAITARKVAEMIKGGLHHSGVHDAPLSSRLPVWRERSGEEWRSFPTSLTMEFAGARSTVTLNRDGLATLQRYLDEGFEPFVAIRHLHRAENTDIPWSRWIEATIAAELAIKEYLGRKRPELEGLRFTFCPLKQIRPHCVTVNIASWNGYRLVAAEV